jgi:hypothetical protein
MTLCAVAVISGGGRVARPLTILRIVFATGSNATPVRPFELRL